MYQLFERRLARLVKSQQAYLLKGGAIGLEKETLRVGNDGKIAQTPHPAALGSALTHPYITTDYSEALIEFITPPSARIGEALHFLQHVQQFVYGQLHDELLWATSMPCKLDGEQSVPIAGYGSSNVGTMKTVYRRGLGHRYGRVMQVIAGVHFNYSFAEAFWDAYQEQEEDRRPRQGFIADAYFAMLRNLQRVGWLIPYLFGASPAVCKSFLAGRQTTLKDFDPATYHEPWATSLRMGGIGYQNNVESEIGIKANYDNLDAYARSLEYAVTTPYAGYQKIGTVVDGEWQQLNANILQIENEYYSTVRPKQVLIDNEKPVLALQKRGVQYIELRSLDVNAQDPLGISSEQLYFLEALMVLCLLHESPSIAERECAEIDFNEVTVAERGRQPELQLQYRGGMRDLREWALEIFDAMEAACDVLDTDEPGTPYRAALEAQRAAVNDPALTPSARMLEEMTANGESFFDYALRQSKQHRDYFLARTLDPAIAARHVQWADQSLRRQREIEAADNITFDEYLRWYYTQS